MFKFLWYPNIWKVTIVTINISISYQTCVTWCWWRVLHCHCCFRIIVHWNWALICFEWILQMLHTMHFSIKVVYYIFVSTPGVVRIPFQTNPRTQVFWESQFLSFCGANENKLSLKTWALGFAQKQIPGTYENVVYITLSWNNLFETYTLLCICLN